MTRPRSAVLRRLLWRNGLVWLGLVLLLGTTFAFAYVPMGVFNGPVALLIAALKAALVIALFMELLQARALLRLPALIGLLFVFVLFALTGTDVLTRP